MEGEEAGSLNEKRFRLLGVPIQTSFWFFPAMAGIGWIVSDDHLRIIPIFMVVMTIAVLAHEFGHALVGRWFGGRGPEIYLVFFGGLCAFRHANFTRWQEMAMVVAGPMVNILLAVACHLALDLGFNLHGLAVEFLIRFYAVNLVLGILNLVPVLPLDGGHILRLLVGRSKLHLVFLIGILGSIAMILLALNFRDYLLLAFFAFFAWYNTGNVLAWWRLRGKGEA
ncbi:MAG: metalloprotease [Verrucomicrobiales bacterium]